MTTHPLLRTFERHIIYDAILGLCPISTIIRLKRVCRATNAAVTDYMGRVYDINRHLSRFFEDPKAFRVVQARTGALVARDDARIFFESYRQRDDYEKKPEYRLTILIAGLDPTIELCQWLEKRDYYFYTWRIPHDNFYGGKNGFQRFDAERFARQWPSSFKMATEHWCECDRGNDVPPSQSRLHFQHPEGMGVVILVRRLSALASLLLFSESKQNFSS